MSTGEQGAARFDSCVLGIAGCLAEARRRFEPHFQRVPLGLPAPGELPVEGLPCTPRDLVQAVADAMGVPCDTGRVAGPADAVGQLVLLEFAALRALTASAEAAIALPEDWRARMHTLLARAQALPAGPPRFETLPGLVRRRTPEGIGYLRLGSGPQALVLLNAFGMSLDVWQALAAELRHDCTVLVVDDAAHLPASGLPSAYYDTSDAPARFEAALRAVLRAESLARCHLASWCAGAKYAIGLARHAPQLVASLLLLTPSFAGEASDEGGDSAFETSLHTMCKLVTRMPQATDNMARSMLALLSKDEPPADSDPNAPAGSALYTLADRATRPWLHAPFVSAEHMISYSRQLMNFRAHAVAASGMEPLAQPLLLVTGERDASTCPKRAAWLCRRLGTPLHVELQAGGHYFIHQNAGITAQLIAAFLREGDGLRPPHPRLRRVAGTPLVPIQGDELVSGEI